MVNIMSISLNIASFASVWIVIMISKGVGTIGNTHSPNIPPRSDPESIIRHVRDQQKVGSSSAVDKQYVKEQVESIQATLILEL